MILQMKMERLEMQTLTKVREKCSRIEWSGVEKAPKLRRARDVKGAAQTWGNSATNDAIRCDARCEAMGWSVGGRDCEVGGPKERCRDNETLNLTSVGYESPGSTPHLLPLSMPCHAMPPTLIPHTPPMAHTLLPCSLALILNSDI